MMASCDWKDWRSVGHWWRGLAASPQFDLARHPGRRAGGFSLANPDFLSPLNISNMMAFLPELGIMALGMTLLLTAGEFDLSVGAVFALAPVIVMLWRRRRRRYRPRPAASGWSSASRSALINGLIVTKIGISSFLVTLSMLLIVRGAALYITRLPAEDLEPAGRLRQSAGRQLQLGPFRLYISLFWFIGADPPAATS